MRSPVSPMIAPRSVGHSPTCHCPRCRHVRGKPLIPDVVFYAAGLIAFAAVPGRWLAAFFFPL